MGQYAKDIDDIHQEVDKFDNICLEERLQEFFGFLMTAVTSAFFCLRHRLGIKQWFIFLKIISNCSIKVFFFLIMKI